METINARVLTLEQILALRVNRDSEVNTCCELVMSTPSNVVIFGPRGVGKTFLVKLIYNKLRETGPEVFPFFLNATELALLGQQGTGAAFPAMLLLQLISSIWRELLHHPYSKLLDAVQAQKRAIKVEDRVSKHLQRLFVQLRYSEFTTTHENANEFSVSAIAKGGLSENLTTERKSVGILPYEFMEYLEELKTEVLPQVGISKLLAIVDEANMMPIEWQEAVVSRHVDIFSNRGMQFVLVAGFVPAMSTVDVPGNFEFVLELRGLPLSELPQLLKVHLGDRVRLISDECLKILHDETEGNPREVVALAGRAVRTPRAGHSKISTSLLTDCIKEYREAMKRLEKGLHRRE